MAWESWGDDQGLLWGAVSEAVAPIAHLETQLETNKLEKRIRDYFSKGAKGLEFGSKPWDELVNEYADKVYSAIFCGLGDREWLAQADFLMCVDAGIKDYFPPRIISSVLGSPRLPQAQFEQTVLAAADRANDEQRFFAGRWETIQSAVEGKKTRKHVMEAVDSAREDAVKQEIAMQGQGSSGGLEGFMACWIDGFLQRLSKVAQGDVPGLVPAETAVQLFHKIVEDSGHPAYLFQEEEPTEALLYSIEAHIGEAYAALDAQAMAAAAPAFSAFGGKGKGAWGKGKGKGFGGGFKGFKGFAPY